MKPEIYLSIKDDDSYSITDNKGNSYTINQIAIMFNRDLFSDWNISFQRLINNGFDINKTIQDYKEMR